MQYHKIFKNHSAKSYGFTLIELLVVISIIGFLSTLTVIAVNNARLKARDSKRVSNVQQVRTALELYYNDANSYPATISFDDASVITNGTITYMKNVPSNPSPRRDGSCPDENYSYTRDGDGASYHITFCLGGASGGILAGTHQATPGSIQNP